MSIYYSDWDSQKGSQKTLKGTAHRWSQDIMQNRSVPQGTAFYLTFSGYLKKKKLLHAQITVASLDEELRQQLLKEISKTNHGVSLSDYYKFVFLVQRLYIDLYFSWVSPESELTAEVQPALAIRKKNPLSCLQWTFPSQETQKSDTDHLFCYKNCK